ncbi:MAG: hypothetical protein ACREFC_03255, partial [Stellaceae bacterium]
MRLTMERGIERLLPAGAVVLALYVIGSSLYWTVMSFNPAPILDAWAFVGLAQNIDWNNFPALLWVQHNEHRLVISRVIALVDYRFFHGNGYVDLVVLWLMQAGSAAIVTALGFDLMAGSFPSARSRTGWHFFIVGTIACLLFTAIQFENLTWSIQT